MGLDRKFIREVRIDAPIPDDEYSKWIPAIEYLSKGNVLEFNNSITFFVGENGTGKSTLIEALAIACKFNPEGGTLRHNFSTHDSHSNLSNFLSVVRQDYPSYGYFLRAESFYNVASYRYEIFKKEIDGGDMVDYHTMSHGEFFMEVIRGLHKNGLYIFDEPEAALSPSKLLTMMCEIKRLIDENSQFIIATHSPILMAFPGATIYHFTSRGIESVKYTDTEHYQVTKTFLDCPERMLKYLFEK